MAPRARALAALGFSMGRSGILPAVSIAVAALTTLGMVAAAFVLARNGGRALAQLPTLASSGLAWGAGVLLAFSSAAHALRRDREQGVRALVQARGGDSLAYLWARVAGLAALLALVVVGGTALTGAAATALADKASLWRVARGSMGSIAYAAAFALMIAPVALAALGARSRAGGYLALLAVLALPELLAGFTEELLPHGWDELTSIPAVLGAIRGAVAAPGGVDGARLFRACLVTFAIAGLASLFVRQQMARVDSEALP